MRSQPRPPSFDTFLELPAQLSGQVHRDHLDVDGHLSADLHVAWAEDSAEVLLGRLGLDERHRDDGRMTVFTAEQRIRFRSEVREGSELSAHCLVLDRSSKACHVLALLLDRTEQTLTSTVEMLLVHVGMDSRTAIAFPPRIAAGLDEQVAVTARLGWTVPVSGTIGIRHPACLAQASGARVGGDDGSEAGRAGGRSV